MDTVFFKGRRNSAIPSETLFDKTTKAVSKCLEELDWVLDESIHRWAIVVLRLESDNFQTIQTGLMQDSTGTTAGWVESCFSQKDELLTEEAGAGI